MEYFSFMNCLDLLTYMISTILIFLSMISLEIPSIQSRCVLAALISIMMWLKMLEWLRVFDSTAFFIKLILQTMVDILPFFVIFFIFIFMFGSALYILSMNRESEEEIVDSIFHGWLFNTFINQYLLSLGEFGMDNFEGDNQLFIYLLFILATFFTQVTVLNMLIAIMGNTFDNVKE